MNSLLVTVLLLASATNGSGGQESGGGKGRVYQVCIRFPSQVHKCPSQTTHVHNLTYQALMIRDGAQSVVDFGLVT